VERAQWFDRAVVGIALETVKPASGMRMWKQLKEGIPVRIGLITELERRGQMEANLYEPVVSGVPAFVKQMADSTATAEVTVDRSESKAVFDSSHMSVTQGGNTKHAVTLRINRTATGDTAVEFRPTAKQSYALKWRETGGMCVNDRLLSASSSASPNSASSLCPPHCVRLTVSSSLCPPHCVRLTVSCVSPP
jgi:hypothetical protein